MANEFNVLDMANQYASDNDINPDDIFKKEVKEETPVETTVKSSNTAPGEWRPDASLIADMPELQGNTAIYSQEELEVKDGPLENIIDDDAKKESLMQMDEMSRQTMNLEEFKKRHNIQLHIPPGEWQVRFISAASDTDYTRAQANLDKLLPQLREAIPFAVEDFNPIKTESDEPEVVDPSRPVTPEAPLNVVETPETVKEVATDTKIIIDKRQANQIVWSPEDIEKIRKSRKVELNIVESDDIKFSSIVDADDNAVDAILQQYTRKTNDVTGVLPASQYRATFTGLTYPEVIGLQASIDMNTTDSERKKWTIAFNHMTNISIGPWEEYSSYVDDKGQLVKVPYGALIPAAYASTRRDVSKFEDFMRKTSFLDINFILWKILCATTTNKEIVSITCGAKKGPKGTACGHTYDWIYDPSALLEPSDIDPAVLKNMEKAGNAGTKESALEVYKTSPVKGNDVVTLRDSNWSVVYGHASAWDYVEGGIYDALRSIGNKSDDEVQTDDVENTVLYSLLNCIKAILIPNGDGTYTRITKPNNLVKALRKLGTVDFQTITTIVNLMLNGYNYSFKIKDAVCPKCHGHSTIPIDKMETLLFMIARSLDSTSVSLTRQ